MGVEVGGIAAVAQHGALGNRQAAASQIGGFAVSHQDHVAVAGIHGGRQAVVIAVVAAGIAAHATNHPGLIGVGILRFLGALLDPHLADANVDFTFHGQATLGQQGLFGAGDLCSGIAVERLGAVADVAGGFALEDVVVAVGGADREIVGDPCLGPGTDAGAVGAVGHGGVEVVVAGIEPEATVVPSGYRCAHLQVKTAVACDPVLVGVGEIQAVVAQIGV